MATSFKSTGKSHKPPKGKEKTAGKKHATATEQQVKAEAVAPRTAAEIGVTPVGPRPVPELSRSRTAAHPELISRTIDNGLQVIAVRKPGTPLVEVRLRVPFSGTAATHSARSELLASTLLLGTGSRTREQVDGELAMVGGHLDASVDPQRLAVTGSVLSTGLPVLLDILAESLVQPAFRRHDVVGERDRLVEHLAIAASQPSVVARHHLQLRRFGAHPVTREMPEPADVAAVGVAALRAMQRKSLVPRGSTLVLVGDLDPLQAIEAAEKALSNWTSTETARVLSSPEPVVGGAVKAFHRDGAVQSQVRLSAAALVRTDPGYPAAQLANLIYGGYFSSRLVENIREDKGYTYSAHSSFEFWPGLAAVTVSFDTTTPSTAAALLEARYELGRLALNAPEAKEVESARNYALGTLATSLATQAGYASTLSSLAGLGLDIDWVREHPGRLAAVTVEDVALVASTLLAPAAFTGVVVGDLEKIGASLAAVGGGGVVTAHPQTGATLSGGTHGFPIAMPVLSRGSADRSEDLRDAQRTGLAWPDARVLTVDEAGRTPMRTTGSEVTLDYRPALDLAQAPPPDAVLLGTVTDAGKGSPIDYWAVPGEVAKGGELWTIPGSKADPSTLREVGGLLSDLDAGLLVAAVAVLNWHRHGSFCPRCGEPSVAESAGWSRMCPNGHQEFPRTDPAVIVLVHDGQDNMVLARQPIWPAGRVSVLAGFTEAGESLEGTVTREIGEEVGLAVTDIGYLGSQPWPFPRSLMVGFAARAEPGAPLYPRAGEIESARWVDRATVRRVLAAGGTAEGIGLPPSISIARRMVEGWAAL